MCREGAILLDFMLHFLFQRVFFFLPLICYLFLFFTMSTTMKKVYNEIFVDLVHEVLKDILLVVNTPPILPNQLLDLIVYGSSLIGLPTPIVTINFSDDFLWASDKSEIYVQYVDYMHEFLTESCVVSPKLNLETDVGTYVYAFF